MMLFCINKSLSFMGTKKGIVTELPIGYRFVPTDEEMVEYLVNKVFQRTFPTHVIQEIDASELYSKPPMNLAEEDPFHGKDWLYFFIHGDEYFYGERKKTRVVGNELGFWSSVGEEDPIYNTDGNIFAFKTYFIYFSGSLAKAKKTQWKMEEFRLPLKFQTKELERGNWVLGRLKRGQDYNSCF